MLKTSVIGSCREIYLNHLDMYASEFQEKKLYSNEVNYVINTNKDNHNLIKIGTH